MRQNDQLKVPTLPTLADDLIAVLEKLQELRSSPRPADRDWRHHEPSLQRTLSLNKECVLAIRRAKASLTQSEGLLPDSWLKGKPAKTKFMRLLRALEQLLGWLTEREKPFRGYKMPLGPSNGSTGDDPTDVADWRAAERTLRKLAADLDAHIRVSRAATRAQGGHREANAAVSSGSFMPGQIMEMFGISDTTLNKYAKRAGITTPGTGGRNFRYSIEQVREIGQAILDRSSDGAMRERCRTALEQLRQGSGDRTETQKKSNGNSKAQ